MAGVNGMQVTDRHAVLLTVGCQQPVSNKPSLGHGSHAQRISAKRVIHGQGAAAAAAASHTMLSAWRASEPALPTVRPVLVFWLLRQPWPLPATPAGCPAPAHACGWAQ